MRWGDQAEYIVFRGAVGGLTRLPTKWSRWLCCRAGWLAGPVLGIRRRVVNRQLAAVFGSRTAPELRRLSARMYEHLGLTLAESFCSDPDQLATQVQVIPDWSELDAALAKGRGVLAVTAHLGNFELGGRILAGRYRVLDVVKPMRNPLFDRYLQRTRARHGIATVPMAESGRAVLTHLRRGGLVTLFVDQDAGRDGVRTDFLGVPASTWTGAARLAVRTGCPIVPVAIARGDGGRHVLHVGTALDPTGITASDEDIAALTARISAAVETYIRRWPEQWFWVHRRWKGAAEAKLIS
jgi:KDO2-lipid IV(A) lauroyltransferase